MKRFIPLPAALICFTLCAASVQAATKYWDIDGANAGSGGATPSGTWNTGTTANWTTDSTGASAATTFADGDEAVFSAGGDAAGDFTVTVSGSPVAAGITLEEGTVTLTGGPISGTPTVTINGATLKLGSAVLPAGANLIVNIPGVLDLNTLAAASCAGLSGNGTVTKTQVGVDANGILTVGNNDATSTFTGSILNNTGTKMGITKIGTGTLLLHPPVANTLGVGTVINAGKVIAEEPQALGSFSVTVNAGTLEIPNLVMDSTLQQYFNGGTILASGGTFSKLARTSGSHPNIGAGASVTLATATSGDMLTFASGGGFSGGSVSSLVTMNGPGTVRLSAGGGNYAGSWTVTAGILQVDNATALGAASRPVKLAGGAMEFRVATNATYSANVTVSGNAAITPSRTNSGSGGITQTLGSLSITNVTLTVAAGDNATSGTMGLTFGATTLTGNGTFAVNPGVSAATLLTLGAVGETGGARTLTKSGDGTLALNGTNTFTGSTIISAGILAVGTNGLITSSPVIDVQANATFDVSAVTGGFVLGVAQTLKGNGAIQGNVKANGTFAPGASIGSLTFSNDLTLSGNLLVEVNKSLSPSNDVMTVTGTLTNAGTGTVTVANLGPALAVGDSFQIFNQPVLNGQAMNMVGGGVTWTNKLAVDGSIAVASLSAPKTPATNLTIASAGPTSFNLGGLGAANSAYGVYATTNVTTPMTNWWLIGTTNSSGGGVIQFLDPQATNKQRFYRFGQ